MDVKWIRKHWKAVILRIIGLFALYILIGVIASSAIHKDVTDEETLSFAAEDCYAETPGTERVLCIDDNRDALTWRLRVIETAEKSLILSTYDLQDDNSGTDVMSALYAAAERGVKVFLIVDGLNGQLKLSGSKTFKALVSHENVTAKFYNPVNLLVPWKATFRLHDKYLIADDQVYILGGRNTYDLFLGDYAENANIDRDLLVYETDPGADGTSLAALFPYFESIWNLSESKEFTVNRVSSAILEEQEALLSHYEELHTTYPEVYEGTDYTAATLPANKVTLLSNPNPAALREPALLYKLCRIMESGDDVILQTPYVICSSYMYGLLGDVADSAETLSILTNAVESGANPWGCSDYLNQKDNISATGAVIYEYLGQRSLHTKTILVDHDLSVIGSFNMDMRSTYLDTEMMLVVDCPELNAYLREGMETDMQMSSIVYPDGTGEYGILYTPTEMAPAKKVTYSVLRILIRPFRYLL